MLLLRVGESSQVTKWLLHFSSQDDKWYLCHTRKSCCPTGWSSHLAFDLSLHFQYPIRICVIRLISDMCIYSDVFSIFWGCSHSIFTAVVSWVKIHLSSYFIHPRMSFSCYFPLSESWLWVGSLLCGCYSFSDFLFPILYPILILCYWMYNVIFGHTGI